MTPLITPENQINYNIHGYLNPIRNGFTLHITHSASGLLDNHLYLPCGTLRSGSIPIPITTFNDIVQAIPSWGYGTLSLDNNVLRDLVYKFIEPIIMSWHNIKGRRPINSDNGKELIPENIKICKGCLKILLRRLIIYKKAITAEAKAEDKVVEQPDTTGIEWSRKHLKLKVHEIPDMSCAVIQVVEQTHIVDKFAGDESGLFMAKNGVTIESAVRPWYTPEAKLLNVRGSDYYYDDTPFMIGESRPSFGYESVLNGITEAVKEYNEFFSDKNEEPWSECHTRFIE